MYFLLWGYHQVCMILYQGHQRWLENSHLSLQLSQTGMWMPIARSNDFWWIPTWYLLSQTLGRGSAWMHLHPFQDCQNQSEPIYLFNDHLESPFKRWCASSILSWRICEIFSSDFLTEVDDLCTWRTKSPRKLCTFWLGQKATARSLWPMSYDVGLEPQKMNWKCLPVACSLGYLMMFMCV